MKSNSFKPDVQTCSYQRFWAFTLAEMMVVLLILSIVLAAMAPIMTTRIKRDTAGSGLSGSSSVWQWAENKVDAYFGSEENPTAMIGQREVVAGEPSARLIINTSDTRPNHILFKNGDDVLGRLSINNSLILGDFPVVGSGNVLLGGNSWLSEAAAESNDNIFIGSEMLNPGVYTNYSDTKQAGKSIANIAIGNNIMVENKYSQNNIAIGNNLMQRARLNKNNIVIGQDASTTVGDSKSLTDTQNYGTDSSIVIGTNAKVLSTAYSQDYFCEEFTRGAIAIGHLAYAEEYGNESENYTRNGAGIAIGNRAKAQHSSIAIGSEQILGKNESRSSFTTEAAERSVAIGSGAKAAAYTIAIGYKANADKWGQAIGYEAVAAENALAWGYDVTASGENSTAIGFHVNASNKDSIAIGRANASGQYSIAIGSPSNYTGGGNYDPTEATDLSAIAIGSSARARGPYSIAIGNLTQARGRYSVAIGDSTGANDDYQISLGNALHKVYIQGTLTVVRGITNSSDRRLKYVGKEFTSGLDKIRQLKAFNYTFKKDEKKIPRVGVIAQDLQKIFPNAVEKDGDGFLTIRMEDMFYALVNAVKELDAKVTAMVSDFAKQKEQLFSAQKDINALKKENKELKAQNKKLEARLNALEAKIK